MTGFFSTMTECDLANHPVSPSPHANQYLLDNLECKQHAYGGNQQHLAVHAPQVHNNPDILFLLKGQVGGGGILWQSSITGGATEESRIGLLVSMVVMDIRKDKNTTEVVLTTTSWEGGGGK